MGIFIDANLQVCIADILQKEGYRSEYLDYALFLSIN
jgi:hypothetical protein